MTLTCRLPSLVTKKGPAKVAASGDPGATTGGMLTDWRCSVFPPAMLRTMKTRKIAATARAALFQTGPMDSAKGEGWCGATPSASGGSPFWANAFQSSSAGRYVPRLQFTSPRLPFPFSRVVSFESMRGGLT
jgi:hypothetical protein